MNPLKNDQVIKALEKDRKSDKMTTVLTDMKFLDESIVARGIVAPRGKSKPKQELAKTETPVVQN